MSSTSEPGRYALLRKTMNNCLLLIDIQNDYFPKGKMELIGIDEAANNAKLLLDKFRNIGAPILHIQHISVRPGATFFLPESSGAEINALVYPQPGETVIQKHYPNSFRKTDLLEILKEKSIEELTVCGAMSHMCIDATTRAAFDFEFQCIVAENACATRDLLFQEKTIKAAEVHAAFMAALSTPYAKVISTQEIINKIA
jgi:nicotinamidase-related amidase